VFLFSSLRSIKLSPSLSSSRTSFSFFSLFSEENEASSEEEDKTTNNLFPRRRERDRYHESAHLLLLKIIIIKTNEEVGKRRTQKRDTEEEKNSSLRTFWQKPRGETTTVVFPKERERESVNKESVLFSSFYVCAFILSFVCLRLLFLRGEREREFSAVFTH
tara:strand:- start:2 stop:487 length:486 start_codon:yes stop_codon:yes gene_type:complete